MYNTNQYVTSDLISSYAWDTTLNFICQTSEKGYALATTTNRKDANIATNSKTKTGEYPADKYSNICDFLGNCYEWTTEYSSVSGKVEAVEDRLHQSLKKVKHVVISNDKKYTKEENPVLDYKTATREELVDFMMNAGIVGCGGAGFPAYVKYKDVKDVENLIINAVECEPYITSDYKVMEND